MADFNPEKPYTVSLRVLPQLASNPFVAVNCYDHGEMYNSYTLTNTGKGFTENEIKEMMEKHANQD